MAGYEPELPHQTPNPGEAKNRTLPEKMRVEMGRTGVYKGTREHGTKANPLPTDEWDDVITDPVHRHKTYLFQWDAIPDCVPTCPIYNSECTYPKTKPDGTPIKCQVMKNFLKSVDVIVLRNYPDIEETLFYRFGIHVLPIYKTYIKLLIAELSVNRPVLMSSAGLPKVHPIYKEIRETARMLEGMWKSLGLAMPTMPGLNPGEGDLVPLEDGDYYEALTGEGGLTRQGMKRKKLVKRGQKK